MDLEDNETLTQEFGLCNAEGKSGFKDCFVKMQLVFVRFSFSHARKDD